ncbi:hypothetical protein BKA66DRAFT_324502 [Pyrenochaeta sp. MPI-SDFR-AT-0127]|nr:hypothetical protein BKA66DRAFT_324502 [Pyrenochaeta sp. MPI-SDFR-AT-0127]
MRACRQCAIDRVRCSRTQPCRRCVQRRLLCCYPPARKAPTRAHDHAGHAQLQARAIQLAAGFDSASSFAVGPDTTAAVFSCAVEIPADPTPTWLSGVANSRDLYEFGQSGLGVSDVNWLSPQSQDAVDLDALLEGFAVAHGIQGAPHAMRDQGGSLGQGLITISNDQQTSACQPSPQQVQLVPESGAMPSCNTTDFVPSPNPTENRFYVDGDGARAPFGGRSHDRDSVAGVEASQEVESENATCLHPPCSRTVHPLVPPAAHDSLIRAIVAEAQLQSLDITLAELPSHQQTQLYVAQYFSNFHPIFPFLRKSLFPEHASREWLLLLAVTVVGSKFVQRREGQRPSESLSRLLGVILRRHRYGYGLGYDDDGEEHVLFVPGQKIKGHACPNLQIIQAGILNIACMLHSGNNTLVQRAFVERHYLVEACHSLQLIAQTTEEKELEDLMKFNRHQAVHKWLARESEIRTGMMIWFLDSIFLYEFDAKPLMQLNDIKVTLPSHDDIWEHADPVREDRRPFSNITLLDAMNMVYIEKKLPPDLGEFSIGLLINAIYRNTKDVVAREQVRLNSWTPTALIQQSSDQPSVQPSWLPSMQTISRWRNSACDCLDVLHWPANSKAAQLSGSEHHTILHLHLARLIILPPIAFIQRFATGRISANHDPTNSQSDRAVATARYQVLQWVIRDQYKARLCLIHCGALYWHVRRYSCDSLLEPYAIYIATLVLWAFCVCMQLPEVVEAIAHDQHNEPEPPFLHLDRPLDDELVQTFVRVGHKMSAYICNVGSIQDQNAPGKILQEGISLLVRGYHFGRPLHSQDSHCCTWGVEKSYVQLLRDLLLTMAGAAEGPVV